MYAITAKSDEIVYNYKKRKQFLALAKCMRSGSLATLYLYLSLSLLLHHILCFKKNIFNYFQFSMQLKRFFRLIDWRIEVKLIKSQTMSLSKMETSLI